MSKDPSDKKPGGEGKQKPVPSGINKGGSTGSAGKTHRRNAGRQGGKKRKKRNRNEIVLSGDRNYGDPFNTPDMVEKGAEKILKRSGNGESSLHYLKPLPPAKAPISPYKRKLKRILFYCVTLLIVLSVFGVLSLTVFFKIDEIIVEGETRYNNDDIIKTSHITTGENLIMCNTSTGENDIWKEYPFIESVSIEKKLVNRVIIHVKEAVPTSVIESEGNYVLLSESGKIIDISQEKQSDVPIVLGARLLSPQLSSSVVYKDKSLEGYISKILEGAEENGLGILKVVDVTNLSKIVIETKNGLHIILGTPENIDYKLRTAKKIITDKGIPENSKGTLDVSLSSSEGGKSYYNSEDPSKPEPSKQVSPEPSTTQSSEASQTETPPDSETTSDGGYDDGDYDDGGYDDGGYDDGGYDDGGYDDGGYDDGGYVTAAMMTAAMMTAAMMTAAMMTAAMMTAAMMTAVMMTAVMMTAAVTMAVPDLKSDSRENSAAKK